MVDLECDATTTTSADATTPESKFCRLCLEETSLAANLFEKKFSTDENNETLLHERLNELFQIKYEKSPNMPSNICKECLQTVDSFYHFRESVHKIESELQKRLASIMQSGALKVIEDIPRAGLNGGPGTFSPEEDAIIIEVNPEQDYESSDDDFSMDSESETEDVTNMTTTSMSTTTADFTVTTAHNALPTDAQTTDASHSLSSTLENQVISVSKKTYTMESAPSNITYSCQYCDMAFSQQDECNEHVNTHDPTGPHVCTFCPMRYINRQQLISHLRATHGSDRPYICCVCNKGFVRRSDLRKHSIVHTGVRPYTCNVCGKSFSRNTNLTKHIRIHSSYKPHICVHCPRSYSTAAELLRHSRSHSMIKRKPVSTQPKESMIPPMNQYSNNSGMEQSGLNPIANLNTAPPSLMNMEDPFRHSILAAQLQHPRPALAPPTTIPLSALPIQPPPPPPPPTKPSHFSRHFACEICSQTFTRERDYQRHQALHLDTLFTCKQCGVGFSRREKLARHELEHHAPQFPCNICRISFNKTSEFELHMKMHELQQSVAMTAQAASLLSAGKLPIFSGGSQQSQVLPQQAPPMLPPQTKEFYGQRPSISDMNFYSQLVPTMNLGFYSETRPEDRNGI